MIAYLLTLAMMTLPYPVAHASEVDVVTIQGKIRALNENTIEVIDRQEKVLIVPKRFIHRKYRAGEQIEINMNRAEFHEVKLKTNR